MILALVLVVVIATMIGSVVYGRQTRGFGVDEWAVGGRRFGVLIFWFLNAGEIYTTFAVLGISGYAFAYGAPAYLALTSVSLAATLGYIVTPRIWAAGRARGLVTQADFFADHFRARWLGVVVGVAGIAALVVYVQIQIVALSLILRLTLGTEVAPLTAASLAGAAMLSFVFLAGLRSAAFAAGVKDILMLVLVIGLCATVAARVGASSILDVYRMAQDSFPGIGRFPGLEPEAGLSTTWLMTAALNVALGTWILPHMFQLCYSAGSASIIRRNAIWQPLYSLSYFFIILLGFGALLAGIQPPGGDTNAVLLQFVATRWPAWVVGLFAGTTCLLALVPGSVLLLTAGSIFGRNIVLPLRPKMTDSSQLLVSRASMLLFAAMAVYLSVAGSQSLVEIGLSAYAAIGMLAPGVYSAMFWPRVQAGAVFAGIVTGYLALLLPASIAFWNEYFPDGEKGLLAMAVNAAALVIITLLAPSRLTSRA